MLVPRRVYDGELSEVAPIESAVSGKERVGVVECVCSN